MRKLLVQPLFVAIFALLVVATGVQAFTVMRDAWPTPNTTYGMDASFTNQGAAWINRANEAAQHWTDLTAFDFVFNAGSANRLRTEALDCNTLANMAPTEDALNIYRTSFIITVNVNPNCPNIVWYTGVDVPPVNTFDLRTVLRHEFGHAAALDHVLGDAAQLMYPVVNPQAVKHIAADDQNGIEFLYNPNSGVRLSSAAWYWYTGATYDNTYSYVGYKGSNWSGGSPFPRALLQTQSWSNQTGASSWFAFIGDRITWVFAKAFNRGWQNVYIDGNFIESINTDDDNDILWQVHRTWEVASGQHIIEVRGLGGGTTYTDLDAYVLNIVRQQGTHDDASGGIQYLGAWTHGAGWQGPINGTASWSSTADDAVVFTFLGDGVTYWYTRAWNRGIAKVTIDGNFVQAIDLYSPNVMWQQSIRWPLAYGTHTIHIAVTGDRHPNSQGTYIDVDQLAVD